MAKKTGLQLNTSSSSEETSLNKKSRKEVGRDIGGNPDDWDYRNLKQLIENYEMAYPGRIAAMAEDVKQEAARSKRTKKFGVISKDSDFRVAFWLPEDLQEVIEAGYPSLWVNPKHVAWFVKCFPEFKRAERF